MPIAALSHSFSSENRSSSSCRLAAASASPVGYGLCKVVSHILTLMSFLPSRYG